MIYLNHASISTPLSQSKVAIEEFVQQWSCPSFKYSDLMLQKAGRLKALLGKLLQTNADNIAIVPNTAFGVSSILNAHPFTPGDEILILDNEFPSNAYPYLAMENRGVTVTQIPAEEFYRDPIAALNRYATERTVIFGVSLVSYSSGYVCDLKQLSSWCQSQNIRFYVDATQGCGVFPINLKESPVDVMVASGYKWLRWPPGTSFACINEHYLPQLRPQNVGWLSTKDRPKTQYPLQITFSESASKFEPGGLNLLGVVAAIAAMEEVLDVGIETISAELKRRYEKLSAELEKRRIASVLENANGLTAGILSINAPQDGERIYSDLIAQDVWITFRNGVMRFSPHYDTPLEDIDQFFSLFDQLLAG